MYIYIYTCDYWFYEFRQSPVPAVARHVRALPATISPTLGPCAPRACGVLAAVLRPSAPRCMRGVGRQSSMGGRAHPLAPCLPRAGTTARRADCSFASACKSLPLRGRSRCRGCGSWSGRSIAAALQTRCPSPARSCAVRATASRLPISR